ncbi:hypothetical protein Dimus_028112 [Dionaea muscipula]
MGFSCCPICQLAFPVNELDWHANSHFEEEEFAKDSELARQIALAPPSPPCYVNDYVDEPFECIFEEASDVSTLYSIGSSSHSKANDLDEKIRSILSSQYRATFHKVEGGLINMLKNCLESEPGYSRSILSGYVDHFHSIASEGVGWTCGWRNIQMVCSHLLARRPEARDVLFGGCGFVPDIASLQRWLEVAWERGFDFLGSNDFNGKIYGSNRWIGTSECATLLRSFGLRARIVDFDGQKNEYSRHVYGPMDRYVSRRKTDNLEKPYTSNDFSSRSRKSRSYQVLIEWVWTYFSSYELSGSHKQGVVVSDKMPLYFQHDGHSRTIIGVQVKHQQNGAKQYILLILDPSHITKALESCLKKNSGWQQLIKRGIHTLRKPQYQLLYVDPGLAHEEEMKTLKNIDSDSY